MNILVIQHTISTVVITLGHRGNYTDEPVLLLLIEMMGSYKPPLRTPGEKFRR